MQTKYLGLVIMDNRFITKNLFKFKKPNKILNNLNVDDKLTVNRRVNNSDDFIFNSLQNEIKNKDNLILNLNNPADIIQNILEEKNETFFERFDTYNGLFNSQQLIGSIDFDDFSKHCFFNSAVSKVKFAFVELFDNFPIDGDKYEFDLFFKKIDGFQKYIYNKIDKNIGYLKFKGNSFIEITNQAGYITSFKRNQNIIDKLMKPVLNPENSNFSFDFRLFIEDQYDNNNNNQVIFQYLNTDNFQKNGFSLFIKEFLKEDAIVYANIVFHVSDITNANNFLATSFKIPVNSWQHVVLNINNNKINSNSKSVNIWINGFEQQINIIENFQKKESLNINDSVNFFIGKGKSHICSNSTYSLIQPNLLKGYIDEFRYFHSAISHDWLIKNRDDNIWAEDFLNLKLYFKFNEPTGIYEYNNLCFDASGNSLHSRITLSNQANLTITQLRTEISNLRYDPTDLSQPKVPLKFENDENNPVILPSYESNKTLNNEMLEEARNYDNFNPNLIFKLFPKHLFEEASQILGFNETWKNADEKTYYIYDNLETQLNDNNTFNLPGKRQIDNSQTFANLILIWARFFDEIKLYIDILPKLINIDYTDIESQDNIVNFFIPLMAKTFGFNFKEIINSPNSKILDGYIIGSDGVDKSQFTLRFIQNEIWKRILVNSRDILQSKGTKSAIKSIFNSVGIIPEEFYRFREFGVNHKKFTDYSIMQRVKNIKFIDFFNTQGDLSLDLSLSYLNQENIKFTNNSITFQFYLSYKNYFNTSQINETLLHVINTTNNTDLFKIKFIKQNIENVGIIRAEFYRNNLSPVIIDLDSINLLNQNITHVCLIIDNNFINKNLRKISLYTQNCLNNTNLISKTIDFVRNVSDDLHIFNDNNTLSNVDKILIKNGTDFSGQLSNIKIWKNALTLNDINMHTADIHSLSNEEFQFLNISKINSLLLLNMSLLDDSFHQLGNTLLPIEFSERNNLPVENGLNHCIKLVSNNVSINPINQMKIYSLICYENDFKFDEPNVENRVNIMGYQDSNLVESYDVEYAPVHEINYEKQKKNDVRFSIEMSNVKHLNEDIGKLFNSIDFFADIVSNFSVLNDSFYNRFEKFSDFYFQ